MSQQKPISEVNTSSYLEKPERNCSLITAKLAGIVLFTLSTLVHRDVKSNVPETSEKRS